MRILRIFALAMLLVAGSLAAQQTEQGRPARADAAGAGRPSYSSAFAGYRRFADEPVASWRAANDEMQRLGGHAGQAGIANAAPPAASGAVASGAQESPAAAAAGGRR